MLMYGCGITPVKRNTNKEMAIENICILACPGPDCIKNTVYKTAKSTSTRPQLSKSKQVKESGTQGLALMSRTTQNKFGQSWPRL